MCCTGLGVFVLPPWDKGSAGAVAGKRQLPDPTATGDPYSVSVYLLLTIPPWNIRLGSALGEPGRLQAETAAWQSRV